MKGALRDGHFMVADDVITPACVEARGADGAFDEAVRRLRQQYDQIAEAWQGTRAEFGLTLSLRRPGGGEVMP